MKKWLLTIGIVPLVKTLRFFWEFNIPYEGVKILIPGLLGRGFLDARGTL